MPKLVTYSGINTSVKEVHPENALLPIADNDGGKFIVCNFEHPSNARPPIDCKVFGKAINFKLLHLPKALSPIDINVLGSDMLSKLEQPENVIPGRSVIVFGRWTDVSFTQFSKHP
ncbi:hypothetical protein M1L52_05150 [Prevotella sp. E13-27]|nr:hypothetical protein [Prevotella sp. E13-27]MCK8621752.1 hypothetical protein [Prevotella sp. E13-27]